MEINIINDSSIKRIYKKDIVRIVNYILEKERKSKNPLYRKFLKNIEFNDIEINFLFVDDNKIKEFNKKYFKRKGNTDIIAFSMLEGEQNKFSPVLGDVVISVETAKRNAKLYGNTFKQELLLLIIHSILHLLGYDHSEENSLMRKKEKEYFKKLVTL